MTISYRQVFGDNTILLLTRGAAVGLVFLLHVVLANYLGASGYGLYSFSLAVTGVLTSLASLGLPVALMRYIGQYRQGDRIAELKGALLLLPGLALVVSVLFGALLWFAIAPLLSGATASGVRYASILIPLFVLEQLRRNAYKGFAKPFGSLLPDEILRPVLLTAIVVLAAVDSGGTALRWYISVTLVLSLTFIGMLLLERRELFRSIKAQFRPREWIAVALPLAFGGIGYLLLNQTDIIMLAALTDMRETGVYSAASRIAMLCQIILGTAAIITVPMISAAFHAGKLQELRRIITINRVWIVALTAPAYILMMSAPAWLLSIFGPEYERGSTVLMLLATGQMLNAVAGPVGLVLSLTGGERKLAAIMAGGAAMNLLLNAVAIPAFGALGAAAASAFTFAAVNAVLLVAVGRLLWPSSATTVGLRYE